MSVRTALVAGVFALCTPTFAVESTYAEISLGELLYRLASLFKQTVSVDGTLTGWGDMAALDSDTTREVMVDLRSLPSALRDGLNQTCTVERHCSATVRAQVVHIRGEGISELGLEAHTIVFEPLPLD